MLQNLYMFFPANNSNSSCNSKIQTLKKKIKNKKLRNRICSSSLTKGSCHSPSDNTAPQLAAGFSVKSGGASRPPRSMDDLNGGAAYRAEKPWRATALSVSLSIPSSKLRA